MAEINIPKQMFYVERNYYTKSNNFSDIKKTGKFYLQDEVNNGCSKKARINMSRGDRSSGEGREVKYVKEPAAAKIEVPQKPLRLSRNVPRRRYEPDVYSHLKREVWVQKLFRFFGLD